MKIIKEVPPVLPQPKMQMELELGEAFHLMNEMKRQAIESGNWTLVNGFWPMDQWLGNFTDEEMQKAFWEWHG